MGKNKDYNHYPPKDEGYHPFERGYQPSDEHIELIEDMPEGGSGESDNQDDENN